MFGLHSCRNNVLQSCWKYWQLLAIDNWKEAFEQSLSFRQSSNPMRVLNIICHVFPFFLYWTVRSTCKCSTETSQYLHHLHFNITRMFMNLITTNSVHIGKFYNSSLLAFFGCPNLCCLSYFALIHIIWALHAWNFEYRRLGIINLRFIDEKLEQFTFFDVRTSKMQGSSTWQR